MTNRTRKIRRMLELGLVKFPEGDSFRKRNGNQGKLWLLDSRGAGANVELRNLLTTLMEESIMDFSPFDVVAGISKSGTRLAEWLGIRIGLPTVNVLSEKRKSGLQRQVEGSVIDKKVLLVDNWLISGKSVFNSISAIESEGGMVSGIIVLSTQIGDITQFSQSSKIILPSHELLQNAIEMRIVPKHIINQL